MLFGQSDKKDEMLIEPIFHLDRLQACPNNEKVRRGGLMASALDLGSSGPCSSPGQGTALYFLYQCVLMRTGNEEYI